MDKPEAIDVKQIAVSLHELLGKEDSHYPSQIGKRFPRILEKIVSLWEKPELDTYLNELMVSDRQDRQGFPDDVAMEVFPPVDYPCRQAVECAPCRHRLGRYPGCRAISQGTDKKAEAVTTVQKSSPPTAWGSPAGFSRPFAVP